MKRFAVLFLSSIACFAPVFSQSGILPFWGNTYSVNPVVFLQLNKEDMNIYDEDVQGESTCETVKITYFTDAGLIYVDIPKQINHDYHSFLLNKGRYLVLASDCFLILYSKDNAAPTLICSPKGIWQNNSNTEFTISSSNSLMNRGILYDTSSYTSYSLGKPWAEASTTEGKGEYISFYTRSTSISGYSVMILNGFISYERPYLYSYNNRVKDLEVLNINGDMIFKITIPDSPNPFFFSFNTTEKYLKYVIRSVYPGSKYNDTCVTLIAPIKY